MTLLKRYKVCVVLVLSYFFFAIIKLIVKGIKICFPYLPDNMIRIAEFCLASVVYHTDFLHQNLPEDHLLFATPLYREANMLSDLRSRVLCRRALLSDPISPTGIPPHISLLVELTDLKESIARIAPQLNTFSEEVVAGVVEELESRCMAANQVMYNGFI